MYLYKTGALQKGEKGGMGGMSKDEEGERGVVCEWSSFMHLPDTVAKSGQDPGETG